MAVVLKLDVVSFYIDLDIDVRKRDILFPTVFSLQVDELVELCEDIVLKFFCIFHRILYVHPYDNVCSHLPCHIYRVIVDDTTVDE